METWTYVTNKEAARRLGAAMRRERVERGITQAQMAENIGCGITTIQTLERGGNVSLLTFITYLRFVDAINRLPLLFPEKPTNPYDVFKNGTVRQRARTERKRKSI